MRICHTFFSRLHTPHHLIHSPWIWPDTKSEKSNNNNNKNKPNCKNHSSWFFDSVVRALPSFFLYQMRSEMCAKKEEEKENNDDDDDEKIPTFSRHCVCSVCLCSHEEITATNNQMNTKCFMLVCALCSFFSSTLPHSLHWSFFFLSFFVRC